MREQHFLAGVDSEPLYTKLYNPRWPHSPEERKLDMDVEIKQLRFGLLLSQPGPSPRDDLLPRRLPAIGTELNEPRLPRAGTHQRRGKEFSSSSQSRCLHKSGTRGYYFVSSRRRSERRNNNYKITSRRSQGVYETADWAVTTRDSFDRANQAV